MAVDYFALLSCLNKKEVASVLQTQKAWNNIHMWTPRGPIQNPHNWKNTPNVCSAHKIWKTWDMIWKKKTTKKQKNA